MTIRTFAEQHRLKVSRDECGDEIIQGRRGHLYFDGPELCLMVTDGQPAKRSSWAELGGLLWMGDISDGVQDVSIKAIPYQHARMAIRLCRIKRKRIMSPAQEAVAAAGLAKARRIRQARPQSTSHNLESSGMAEGMVRGGSGKLTSVYDPEA